MTYATWDPANSGASITFTNGNLTATKPLNPTYQLARSTQYKTTGKWYWEVTFAVTNGDMLTGIGNNATTLDNWLGATSGGYGYDRDGQKYNNGTGAAYGATFGAGDVISSVWDAGGGTLTFWKNGVSQGTAFTGLSGSLCPQASRGAITNGAFTANFGATAFVYTPPAGYIGVQDIYNLDAPTSDIVVNAETPSYSTGNEASLNRARPFLLMFFG